MKRFFIVLLALFVFATPTMADWNDAQVAKAADVYLNDQAMLSFTKRIDNAPAYRVGYCGSIGEAMAGEFGSNQPALFEIGIQNQNIATYTAACNAMASINDRMTADDARALTFIIAKMVQEDGGTKDTLPVDTLLYTVDWFAQSEKNNFSAANMVRSFINLSEVHPNGLPKQAKEFFKQVFLGRTNAAMSTLASLRPSDETKAYIADFPTDFPMGDN